MMRPNEDRTRRHVLQLTGAASLGMIAGCLGDNEEDDGEPTDDGETDATTDDSTTDDTGENGATGYTVSMEPMGEVTFEEPPERWFPYTADYADMGVALGQADGLLAVGIRDRFGTHYYEELPDVNVDVDELAQLWQGATDKEIFYDLGADVHLIDPNFMINRIGWNQADITEIENGVAPFFGNSIFSRSYEWHDYPYYSLYEAFEIVAELFQETERYEAFADLHDAVLEDVQSRLPDESPSIAILAPESPEPEAFYGYTIDGGTQTKQWEDLGAVDALAESGVGGYHETGGTLDYETLLDVDPDALVFWQEAGVTAETFEEDIVAHLEDHGLGSNLTAVETGRVIFGGHYYQGPIIHLFQLEMAAQGLFPDEFGDEELFDREELNAIVAGTE